MGTEHRPWLYGASVTVQLSEETIIDGMAGLRWQLRAHLANGARYIVVDVSQVRHLSSATVSALLGAHRVCRTRGGSVVMRNPSRRTLDLLTRSGLHQVFKVDRAKRAPSAPAAGPAAGPEDGAEPLPS